MQAFNLNYNLENVRASHKPVYVFEIVWTADGTEGVDGVNDIYFGTVPLDSIANFPYPERYYPYLDASSFSSLSHKVDPISGVSTLGSVSVDLHDYNGNVSAVIKTAQDAGYGLRRQRVKMFLLYDGMDWSDRIRVRTMQVSELRLSKIGSYKLTCVDIQRNLQKTIFNPRKSIITADIAASGAITVKVPDNSLFEMVSSVAYGLCGFVQVNDEIMRYTSKTLTTDLNVAAPDRGLFATTAKAHSASDDMQEIIVLNENPATIALRVMQSSGVRFDKGVYDTFPAHWGCSMQTGTEVDTAGWELLGRELTGLTIGSSGSGYQFEFVFDKGIDAKKFIEADILKALGGYGFVKADGSYSARAYNDLSNADKSNAALHANVNNVVKWGELKYNYAQMANELWLDYVESPALSGKYIRTAIFNDEVSKAKWGQAKQLRYQMRGAIGTAAYISALYQRFQRVMARYSRPPLEIALDLLPREHGVEIGDIVRVDLPITDLLTGTDIDRAFEVLSVNIASKTGAVRITCMAQPEKANFWFNGVGDVASVTISPATASIATTASQQLVARAYDANGNQVAPPSIVWTASGNVTVDTAGLVVAGAVGAGQVYATVGSVNSNTVTITITASAGTGTVAAVTVSPASVGLEVGETQAVVAQSFDSSGIEINGVTYNWTSSNAAVATVAAGSSASNTVTAIADGAANIIAVETVSSVASPNVVTTVAALPPAEFNPPSIADVVYQVGTQLDATDSRITGSAGSGYVIVDGSDFSGGDYWFDGSVTLNLGDSCTINNNVRFFAYGDVTINGTVDGIGRGLAGGAQSTHSRLGNFPGGFIWSVADGNVGTGVGLTGKGGVGGFNYANGAPFAQPAAAGAIENAAAPVVQIQPVLPADGAFPWTQVSGIPNNMQGSGGGGGSAIGYQSTAEIGGAGGNGGAGLAIMARGIFITGTGLVDLSGGGGGIGVVAGVRPSYCGGGGGGGGSFIGLAEKTANGITNMVIDSNRVILSGGIGAISSGWYVWTNGSDGGTGAFISQVIG